MEKGYSIPIIDISKETHRQVIIDREADVYLGHPTVALLDDKQTMIIVYPKSHGNGQIVMKRSTDGGLNWSERLNVPDNWSTSLEVPTIYKVNDKNGVQRLIMFSGLKPIRMAYSEDSGETWTPLMSIGSFGGVTVMGDIECVGDGKYIALFHDDGRFMGNCDTQMSEVFRTGTGADMRTKIQYRNKLPDGTWGEPTGGWIKPSTREGDEWVKVHTSFNDDFYEDKRFILYQTESDDGGLKWKYPRVIATHPTAQICEPAIIRSPDGKQLTVLMRENTRKHNGFRIYSDDNGETWSEPIEMPGALTGDRHCSQYLPDGRLFISFRDTTLGSPTWGDWVAWVGTYDDIVNNREGQYRVRIMENFGKPDCAYPTVDILADGTIFTSTYGHWTQGEPPYIVGVRFKINELEELLK
ncbi:MAG: glycoside hydrolase [Oscillospiraceae bacterium]|nr:glycoside hydrolase [Oscillospiraceae bacterium]